ncbi:MAG: GNAT family N-acetyltransferase, partial [Coriobacteriales bacterium]
AYMEDDAEDCMNIWNEVVEEGNAFPQDEKLVPQIAGAFFKSQSAVGVAEIVCESRIAGLYILHPNNVGRCSHIANASYAVSAEDRGRRIGEMLVRDSLVTARDLGFRILQFNAVVASNEAARHLYEKIGFVPLGTIPGGFRMDDGTYEDIIPYVYDLTK